MGSYITKMFGSSAALVQLAAVDFFIQYTVFIVSAFLKTEKFYDFTGIIPYCIVF